MRLAALDSFSPLCIEPEDFARFWQATVDNTYEVDAMPVLARQKPVAEGLTLDHLTYKSLGHETIAGYLLAHDGPEPKPLVIHSHGYNAQYDVMLNWANAGCHVFGIDFRGFGRSSGLPLSPAGYIMTGIESPQTSIVRGAVADLVQAVKTAKSLLGWRASSVILYGFSFGGAMATMAASLVDELDLLVVGQPTLGWHKERLRLSTAGSSAEIKRYIEQHPEQADTVMRTLDYFETMHFAARIEHATFLGIGLDDDVVPSRSVFAIGNCLPREKTELRILPVAHSADPRESLWAEFDEEWLAMARNGLPAGFGNRELNIGTIERAIA